MEKFKFGDEIRTIHDNITGREVTLHRIYAIRDFNDVKKGECGGWIESERNLSHVGNCWVYTDAMVFDHAYVCEDARIQTGAMVYGGARVSGTALIGYDACIYGIANVKGCSRISHEAHIYGNALIENSTIIGNISIGGNALIQSNDDYDITNCNDGEMVLYRCYELNGTYSIRISYQNFVGVLLEDFKDTIMCSFQTSPNENTSELMAKLYNSDWNIDIKSIYRKYELTEEIKIVSYLGRFVTLHRIRSLRNFGGVKIGDLGGWVESEFNLSHDRYCWIADDAMVYGASRVTQNARISDNACVNMTSFICDTAHIKGNAKVTEGSYVGGNVTIGDDARVVGMSKLYKGSYGDCSVIHGCNEDNSINEQISPMEKDMDDDEYPDISDLHLKTHGEKEKETIDHVIENSGDVFERTGVYATVVYHETNSNHPRFHCAYIMKHEASPNLFYYIHAGDDICPYCGAIDSQCLCDLDDEDDAYTKEEINEMLHDYGYDDDLFHMEETEKEVPLDINDSILSKLSNGTFDEHIKDIYKDATNVYSGTHDEITEFLNSNTVDDIENDDAMTQYIAAILLLCERLQLIHSIQTDDILLAVESMLHSVEGMLHSEPSNNQPQESKEMSIPTTTEDVKKYVKSIVSNTNITIQKNELLKLLTQYFDTILDDINDNYDKFILDEITGAFSCLFALMTVEPDINEFIDEILDIFTSPVKYGFRYDMIKHGMASCIHYISNFNDKFHHKYGFISGFGALFQIIEAYGIELGKLIHDAYIMYMRLFM